MKSKKRIVLAEDQTILREGLSTIVSSREGFDVVGEAKDGYELIQQIEEWNPDLLLLDITMPKMTGLSVVSEIKQRCPSTKVLMLTVHSEEEFVLSAFEAGAEGYCLKDSTRTELLDACERVLAGERYISPGIAHHVLEGYLKGREPLDASARWDNLTPREQQVLKLIAEGNKNSEIAEYLCISMRTVEKHRANIMEKLGLHNVADLTAYAIKKGLVER